MENLPIKAKEVYSIFVDFFGEDKVDIQGFEDNSPNGFILVWFPFVRITNEYDKYVDINDLYAKVPIDSEGRMDGRFGLNRADYTLLHMMSNYMHSHISCIPTGDFTVFQNPCTGSGPINSTIANLNREFDESIWNLFCLELSKYVTVESISGVPYHRLEELGKSSSSMITAELAMTLSCNYYIYDSIQVFIPFVLYLLNSKELEINYRNNCYSLVGTDVEIIIKISNLFIKWYNTEYKDRSAAQYDLLLDRGILQRVIISDGKLYRTDRALSVNRCLQFNGQKMCTFKGKDILITVRGETLDEDRNTFTLLSVDTVKLITTNILNVINYKYGNTEANSTNIISGKVRFL